MAYVIVLFNLKSTTDVGEYESWARVTDLPTVNALSSVNKFTVLKGMDTFSGAHSVANLRRTSTLKLSMLQIWIN